MPHPLYQQQKYQIANQGAHLASHNYNQNDGGVISGKSLPIQAIEIRRVLARPLRIAKIKCIAIKHKTLYICLIVNYILIIYLPIAQSTNTPSAKNGCNPNATGINAAE